MSPETAASLETLGEIEVAKRTAVGDYGVPGSELRQNVESWLHAKSLEAAARRESREDRMLLSTNVAARWSMYAAIAAMIATIVAAKDQISVFILWLL